MVQISDRIGVICAGRLAELADAVAVFDKALHP
jgi:ABC-type dipeptide/oligopeptide/nickel transport system ATPase component